MESYTHEQRAQLLQELSTAIDLAGGWVLDRHALSATTVELQMEVQGMALPEVYGALLGCGLELTRNSHRALAERCTCSLHLPPHRGLPSLISLRLQVHFLPTTPQPTDVTRLLLSGAGAA